jgi:hypothetical protein
MNTQFNTGQVVYYVTGATTATVHDPGSTETHIMYFNGKRLAAHFVKNYEIIDYQEYLSNQRDDKINSIINEYKNLS